MICEKKRIAYCKFPAEDLVYSGNEMVGKNCGKRQTVFLKVLYTFSLIIIIIIIIIG